MAALALGRRVEGVWAYPPCPCRNIFLYMAGASGKINRDPRRRPKTGPAFTCPGLQSDPARTRIYRRS
jgi:hypothetical protein